MRAHHLLVVVVTTAAIAFMATLFHHNLPHWCEHPEGNGNWMVQPLCAPGQAKHDEQATGANPANQASHKLPRATWI